MSASAAESREGCSASRRGLNSCVIHLLSSNISRNLPTCTAHTIKLIDDFGEDKQMEAAGLALAIAGLAGQAISGITTLKAFFAAYRHAQPKLSTLNFELESLTSTLLEVQQILLQARRDDGQAQLDQRHAASHVASIVTDWLSEKEAAPPTANEASVNSTPKHTALTALDKRMALCAKEVVAWNTASNGLNIGVWSDMRAFARKIKIATSKDLFEEIATRITSHRQAIGNSLSSLTL